MTAAASHTALAANLPEGQVEQGVVLQIGFELLNADVFAVELVGGHGV